MAHMNQYFHAEPFGGGSSSISYYAQLIHFNFVRQIFHCVAKVRHLASHSIFIRRAKRRFGAFRGAATLAEAKSRVCS